MSPLVSNSILACVVVFVLPVMIHGFVEVRSHFLGSNYRGHKVTIRFSDIYFTEFSHCLCKKKAFSCTARYNHLEVNHVSWITDTENSQDQVEASFYKCAVDHSDGVIQCTRQININNPAGYQNFSFRKAETCDVTCVGVDGTHENTFSMEWSNSHIKTCIPDSLDMSSTFETITTSVKPQTVEVTTQYNTEQTTRETTTETDTFSTTSDSVDHQEHTVENVPNKTAPFTGENRDESNNIGIIVAVVASLIILAITILVGVVLWRKRRLGKKSRGSNFKSPDLEMSSSNNCAGAYGNTVNISEGETPNPYTYIDQVDMIPNKGVETHLPPNTSENRNVQFKSSDAYNTDEVNEESTSPYSVAAESSVYGNLANGKQDYENCHSTDKNKSFSTADAARTDIYSLAGKNSVIGNTMGNLRTSASTNTEQEGRNVYTKLHEKDAATCVMENPYDALLTADEASTLPDVVKSSRPTNEMSEYSLSQPVTNYESANQCVGNDYEQVTSRTKSTISLVPDNGNGKEMGNGCVDNEHDYANTNPYFELEKDEDADYRDI